MPRLALLLLLAGCAPPSPAATTPPLPTEEPDPIDEVPPRSYDDVLADLAAARRALGTRWNAAAPDRPALLAEARSALHAAIRDDIIPPWFGTPWEFYGTSEIPGQGSIACGYFVTTVLRDAGIRLARVQLAQQASEHIVRTFADRGEVTRTHGRAALEVVQEIKERGAGLYTIGLDFHVGLLSWDGEGRVEMCHSSVLAPGTVICEDAARSEAMISGIHVLGPVLSDRVVEAWIEGRGVPTALPR